MTDDSPKPIRIIEVPAKDVSKLETILCDLHNEFYTIMDVRLVSIDLEPYYHVFAHYTPIDEGECICEDCAANNNNEEDDDGGPIGFRGE